MQQELKRINYLGETQCSHISNKLSGHIELHIEQRRILEDTGRSIGVVTNIQGIRWYRIAVHGLRAHAGSTPMDERADALVGASSMVLYLNENACKAGAVATVGVLELDRPSSNTIPGVANFTLDLRHASETELDNLELSFRKYADQLVAENGAFRIDIERIWHSPAVEMDQGLVSCVNAAAANIIDTDQIMYTTSLAGHDSAMTALRVPTAMIFVPSKDGISHAPEEFTSKKEWCVKFF